MIKSLLTKLRWSRPKEKQKERHKINPKLSSDLDRVCDVIDFIASVPDDVAEHMISNLSTNIVSAEVRQSLHDFMRNPATRQKIIELLRDSVRERLSQEYMTEVLHKMNGSESSGKAIRTTLYRKVVDHDLFNLVKFLTAVEHYLVISPVQAEVLSLLKERDPECKAYYERCRESLANDPDAELPSFFPKDDIVKE